MRPRKFSEELIASVLGLRGRGLSYREIAYRVGLSASQVGYIVTAYGKGYARVQGRQAIPEEVVSRVKELLEEGHSYREVAEELGLPYERVRYIANKKLGISRRSGRLPTKKSRVLRVLGEIERRLGEGATCKEVAEDLGLSYTAMIYVLHEQGTSCRELRRRKAGRSSRESFIKTYVEAAVRERGATDIWELNNRLEGRGLEPSSAIEVLMLMPHINSIALRCGGSTVKYRVILFKDLKGLTKYLKENSFWYSTYELRYKLGQIGYTEKEINEALRELAK